MGRWTAAVRCNRCAAHTASAALQRWDRRCSARDRSKQTNKQTPWTQPESLRADLSGRCAAHAGTAYAAMPDAAMLRATALWWPAGACYTLSTVWPSMPACGRARCMLYLVCCLLYVACGMLYVACCVQRGIVRIEATLHPTKPNQTKPARRRRSARCGPRTECRRPSSPTATSPARSAQTAHTAADRRRAARHLARPAVPVAVPFGSLRSEALEGT
jgi:hypothetical protein